MEEKGTGPYTIHVWLATTWVYLGFGFDHVGVRELIAQPCCGEALSFAFAFSSCAVAVCYLLSPAAPAHSVHGVVEIRLCLSDDDDLQERGNNEAKLLILEQEGKERLGISLIFPSFALARNRDVVYLGGGNSKQNLWENNGKRWKFPSSANRMREK